MTLEEFADEYGFIADQVLRYHVLPGDAFSVEQLANEANARPGTCVCMLSVCAVVGVCACVFGASGCMECAVVGVCARVLGASGCIELYVSVGVSARANPCPQVCVHMRAGTLCREP